MATTSFTILDPVNLPIADNATVSDSIGLSLGDWLRLVDVRVPLDGLRHTFPGDLDFLLRGPDGRSFEFWSDAGGSFDISIGLGFEISDFGASLLPFDTPIVFNSIYRPADYGALETSDNWGLSPSVIINHPVPNGTATLDSVFGGTFVNGNWTLYVRDDAPGDVGILTQWGLDFFCTVLVKPDDLAARATATSYGETTTAKSISGT